MRRFDKHPHGCQCSATCLDRATKRMMTARQMGRKGGKTTGASKVRGDADHYRALAAKSAEARRRTPESREECRCGHERRNHFTIISGAIACNHFGCGCGDFDLALPPVE